MTLPRFQFSLRTVFILLTVAAVLLAAGVPILKLPAPNPDPWRPTIEELRWHKDDMEKHSDRNGF